MQAVIICCKLPLVLDKTQQEESRRLFQSEQSLDSQEGSVMIACPVQRTQQPEGDLSLWRLCKLRGGHTHPLAMEEDRTEPRARQADLWYT